MGNIRSRSLGTLGIDALRYFLLREMVLGRMVISAATLC